jgi:nicotinate-nucleotide--dimethylbenzimidazole phosphoribosyltransferase
MEILKRIVEGIKPLDVQLMKQAQKRLNNLTKPKGSLGRLEGLARKIVGITGKRNPSLEKKVIFTMASDHGVTEEKVSLFPQEVTVQMVENFLRGGAAINVLARGVGAKVVVVDMGVARDLTPHPNLFIKKVGYGTKNMAKGPAMSREEAAKAVEAGIDVLEKELKTSGIDIIGTGDMGIGNTTPSSAIISCITGSRVEDVTGRGTGIGDEAVQNKIRVIKKALKTNRPDPEDPLDILAKVGGYEIGGLAGCMLAAVRYRIPAVIDGFISTASALIATKLSPLVKDYLISSHRSAEKGHQIALEYLGQTPLFNLDMRLGEGTGAALGIALAELSVRILTEMATFEEAGVSSGSDK